MTEPKKKFCYLEEYNGCSCTAIEYNKSLLLGYCRLHGSERKRRPLRIPYNSLMELGHIKG